MRILVVGAGIGGLAAATMLRRDGHDVDVVERWLERTSEGFGITIPANGTRALAVVGVLDTLRAVSVHASRFEYVAGGEVVVSASLVEGFDGWPWLCLLRSDLIAALTAKAGPVRYGVGVTHLAEDADGVTVTFTDGAQAAVDLVVGADGTGSTVRTFLPGDSEPAWAGLLYYRALIDDPSRPPVLRGFLEDGCLFGIFPASPGRVYAWGAIAARDVTIDPVTGRRRRMIELFSKLGEEPQRVLAATAGDEAFSCTPPSWVRRDVWHSDRIVLIGDAAHASPPFMAEGACLAMEDAIVLADCLLAGAPLHDALVAYTHRRRPRAEYVHRVVEATAASITTHAPVSARAERLRAAGPDAMSAQLAPLLAPL